MPPSVRVLLGPSETTFGIARLIELPDGADRIEVFDEAGKVWRESSSPDLGLWDLAASEPLSPAIAKRLGLADPANDTSDLPLAPPMFSPKGLKARDEMIKNGYDPRTLVPSTVDGMPVYDRDLDEELNSLHILKAEKSPMPQDHSLLSAPRVLKPETVKAVLGQSLRVQQIADRWASGSPKKVKEMEAAGTLLERLRAQADLEYRTIADARVGGANSDVPDGEILSLHDIPPLPF